MPSEPEPSALRQLARPYVVLPALVLVVWIVFALFVRPHLAAETLTGLGSVGDAAGPLATAATLAALMLAFQQARDAREQAKHDREEAARDREQSRLDRESAYLDRLAQVYARWIPIARSKLHDIEMMSNAINHAWWHGNNDGKLLGDHPKPATDDHLKTGH